MAAVLDRETGDLVREVVLREAQTQTILDSRSFRCDPKCPGWVIDSIQVVVQTCDECLNRQVFQVPGVGLVELIDKDVARLKAARKAIKEY